VAQTHEGPIMAMRHDRDTEQTSQPSEVVRDRATTRRADDVVMLRWPDQAAQAADLRAAGIPRLLVVEPGAPPPPPADCLQDWVRLPIDHDDMRARLVALLSHTAVHPNAPALDEYGQLTHRRRSVFLSPTEARIAGTLVASFGRLVPDGALIADAWPDGDGSVSKLRVHVTRIRQRIEPLGLTIRSQKQVGRVMEPDRDQIDAPSQ
jgi:hypothetical protein